MISIIIPTLNEAKKLPELMKALFASCVDKEIIVVDGGSQDETRDIARTYPINLLTCDSGRGQQLHTGALAAKGDILFFLHADSQISPESLSAIQTTLERDSESIGGNFKLLFAGDRLFYRFMNHFYAWIRQWGLYYGDSGIFIRRSAYEQLGGFGSLPIMEDYDFVRRMERCGKTCCIQEPAMITSTRRFEGKTPIQMFWLWGKMHLLYAIGVPGTQLKKQYDGEPHGLNV